MPDKDLISKQLLQRLLVGAQASRLPCKSRRRPTFQPMPIEAVKQWAIQVPENSRYQTNT